MHWVARVQMGRVVSVDSVEQQDFELMMTDNMNVCIMIEMVIVMMILMIKMEMTWMTLVRRCMTWIVKVNAGNWLALTVAKSVHAARDQHHRHPH